jgi:hypothetical protein
MLWNPDWDDRMRVAAREGLRASTAKLALVNPSIGAVVQEFVGGFLVYHGPRAAMTSASRVGTDRPLADSEFEELEHFFFCRGVPARVPANEKTHPDFVKQLIERGYQRNSESLAWWHPLPMPLPPANDIFVSEVTPDECSMASEVIARGYWEETQPHDGPIEKWSRDIFLSLTCAEGNRTFLALRGDFAGGGVLNTRCGIATLRTASTRFRHRNFGVQKALLRDRLLKAVAAGADVATLGTAVDGASAHNVAKLGFAVLRRNYTMTLHPAARQGDATAAR